MTSHSTYRRYGKRLLDILLCLAGIIILLPLILILCMLVRINIGSPIFFFQKRVGFKGAPFILVKFRTMSDVRGPTGQLLPDDLRLSRFGRLLRSTSLDELPELWNVLRGQMSLVGPRPLLMDYLERYSPEEMRRHDVKPGLTGLAQISGRNSLPWSDRFALDLRYVQEHTLTMDISILIKTIGKVLSRDGITSEGCLTGVPFEPEPPVVVIGAGGHGKIVVSILQASGSHVEAVYDDDESLWGRSILGVPVTGPINRLRGCGQRRCVLAIGNNQRRAAIAHNVETTWISAVHPTAVIHATASIFPGAVVCAGAVIQPDCRVGRHAIVNTGATLDHDSDVGDFASIGPGSSLAGSVRVCQHAMIGTGCAVLPGIRIGQGARIGAGATVTRDVADGITAYGIPARPVHQEPARSPSASWPEYDEEQIAAVDRVLRSGKVNCWTGDECKQFEHEYASELGIAHAIAVANGTVALELALQALEIRPGDEVIVPSRTFIASASAVVARGGTPVVADLDPHSQNVTSNTIEAVLSPRTKAVIVVHLAGWPCDMDPIMALARERGLFVVEDCAQAHGARYKGRPVGSIGHINAFSFCQDKIITTGGEGGLVTTNDPALWDRAWSYKDHGKCRSALTAPHQPGSFRFVHESFGTNWRMTEMQAAIGRVQLRRLATWVEQRRQNADRIMRGLADFEALSFSRPGKHFYHSHYRLYGFVAPQCLASGWSRDRIISELLDREVSIGSGSCGEIYREKAFAPYRPATRLPVAQTLHDTSLAFLVHPTLQPSHIEHTIQACRDVLTQALPQSHRPLQRAA